MNPNSGYSPVPQDVICRHDKGSNHSRVEPEPAGDPEVQLTPRPSKVGDRLIYNQSESSVKDFSSSMQKGVGYDVTFSEDEDACPTCLEGKLQPSHPHPPLLFSFPVNKVKEMTFYSKKLSRFNCW